MNSPIRRFAPVLPLLLAPLAGCATVSPPPSVMALGGASQGPVGGTAVTAFGAGAVGVFIEPSLGGGARVAHRLSDSLAVGVDGVAGARVGNGGQAVPQTLFAGRAHVQVNPGGSANLALTFGGGGGATDNGLGYVTADAGARVSGRFSGGFFEPFAGAVLALSVPASTPADASRDEGNDRRFLPTAYAGIDGGFALHPSERLSVSLDLLVLGGYSAANNAFLIVPSAGVRYAFGGEAADR